MGLNLAFAVGAGSAVMVFSDIQAIRDDRHSNVAFGTMIHLFYAAVASWAAVLGFSSFKAITKGNQFNI